MWFELEQTAFLSSYTLCDDNIFKNVKAHIDMEGNENYSVKRKVQERNQFLTDEESGMYSQHSGEICI